MWVNNVSLCLVRFRTTHALHLASHFQLSGKGRKKSEPSRFHHVVNATSGGGPIRRGFLAVQVLSGKGFGEARGPEERPLSPLVAHLPHLDTLATEKSAGFKSEI